MKTTRYFEEQVLRKRPYLERNWIAQILAAPLRRDVQEDGRIRLWGRVDLPEEGKSYILRVVMLEDGETVHNAFFDLRPKLSGGRAMKLHYYPETDSLYIELRAEDGADTREIAEGVNADFGADGMIIGIDIDHASKLDLTTLETSALPFKDLKAA